MRWLAELDLLMAVDGYPSIADLRALRALNACDVSYWLPAQPVDATQALNFSAGVSNPSQLCQCSGLRSTRFFHSPRRE
jgi:hypothetical protein